MDNNTAYKTLVVEDEKMARTELINALKEDGKFEVVGEAANVSQAYELIVSTPANVVFLDIGLPGGNAFYLLSELKKRSVDIPPVIVVTANTEYEYAKKLLNEYNQEIIYILNKPFWSAWIQHYHNILDSLLARAQELRDFEKLEVNRFVNISSGKKSYLIDPAEIVYIQTGPKGKGKTQVILKSNATLECSLSLAQLLLHLPSSFFQINRFEAINLNCISMIDHGNRELVLQNGQYCSIGSAFYNQFLKLTRGY
ncbi:MAG: DNA-binding response regulator [Saprospirales bacterium]|nr:MAG: DNA-binding response regulator [Saprospirales bacterium]